MSQATADLPTAQEQGYQADNAGSENANLDLRSLGIPSELMTELPVDTPSPQAREALEMLSQQNGNVPAPQQPPGYQPPQNQQLPPSQPQPQQQGTPQQGLPNNAPPQPPQAQQPPHYQQDNLANNYRFNAKGDPVKQLAFTLLKENPALSLIEADTKARERMGMTPTPEEITLEQQIAAKQAEADQAAEDMDLSTSRKLDREVAESKSRLEEQRRQRESTARQQIEFETVEMAAQDRVGHQFPDSFVEGSPMSQTMRAINQAMINAADPRVDDPNLIEVIAEQAAAQLRQQGLQPGWTHYPATPPAAPPAPIQPQAPYQPPYQGYPPPQFQYAPPPQQQGYYPPQQQQPVPVPYQLPSYPPIASGAAGRSSQVSGTEKVFQDRLTQVHSGDLDDYNQLVEDFANGRI